MNDRIIKFCTDAFKWFLITICILLLNNNTNTVFQELTFILGIWQLLEIIHLLSDTLLNYTKKKLGKKNKL